MTESNESFTYLSLPLLSLSAERKLPGNLYLCLNHKMVRYRNKEDVLDSNEFNKLVYNHVKVVFLEAQDRELFVKWIDDNEKREDKESAQAQTNQAPEVAQIIDAAKGQRRAMMDLFEAPKEDKQVRAAVETSKKLVSEFLKHPFALNNIQAMQKYSKGVVDHAVNVSVLSVFLGLRMGYSHQLILENLAMGGLFHDVGKILVEPKENTGDDSQSVLRSEDDPAMQQHPRLALEVIDKIKEIPNEVRMIVAQHHEYLDGTGYPGKLKGLAVYDLARLVGIANIYDNLISQSTAATMKDRAIEAIAHLEKDYEGKLDPKKLEKVIKILRYSFL